MFQNWALIFCDSTVNKEQLLVDSLLDRRVSVEEFALCQPASSEHGVGNLVVMKVMLTLRELCMHTRARARACVRACVCERERECVCVYICVCLCVVRATWSGGGVGGGRGRGGGVGTYIVQVSSAAFNQRSYNVSLLELLQKSFLALWMRFA